MKKIIAMFLALCICLVVITVFAFASEDKMTVKVVAPFEWEECYVYAWQPEAFGSWPGTKVTDGTFELSSSVEGMVINAGMGKPQTVDILDLAYVAGTEVIITIGETNDIGKHTYTIETPQPETSTAPQPTTSAEPTVPTESVPVEKYTLTVEAPSTWPTVYVYTWDPPSFGDFPGTEMPQKSENTYECEIDGNLTNLVFYNNSYMQTSDIKIIPGRNVLIKIAEDAIATVTYPDFPNPRPIPLPEYPLSNYRVVGNAEWLGNWNAAFDGGRMFDMGDGVYRKNFDNVPPGSYEIKITKDGKWDGAYGYNGQNYCFTVSQKTKITVDFVFRDGEGIIEVYGMMIGWAEDDEENPKASDLPLLIPAVLLLTGAVALPVALYKRKNIQ